jgi:hypothetical protein
MILSALAAADTGAGDKMPSIWEKLNKAISKSLLGRNFFDIKVFIIF